MSERILRYWQNLPRFQRRLEQERKKLLRQGIDNLGATFNLAVRTLRSLLIDKDTSIRLRAAQAIVDYNFKILEREKEKKPQNPYDEYIDVEGGETVKSLYEKFLRLPKVQAENTRRAQEKWQKSRGDEIKIKDP